MGLDWIAAIRMRQADREDYIRHHYAIDLASGRSLTSLIEKHAPVWEKPCRIVGARQMKDLPDSRILAYDHLAERKEQHQQESFAQALGEPMLSREEYSRQLHWRERNIREAVHWLRTCASYDIHMQPDY